MLQCYEEETSKKNMKRKQVINPLLELWRVKVKHEKPHGNLMDAMHLMGNALVRNHYHFGQSKMYWHISKDTNYHMHLYMVTLYRTKMANTIQLNVKEQVVYSVDMDAS